MSLILDAGALIAVERDDRATAAVIEAARQQHRVVVVPAWSARCGEVVGGKHGWPGCSTHVASSWSH